MAERCAVIGVGQTKHDSKRIDVSQVGLVREAALRRVDQLVEQRDVDLLAPELDGARLHAAHALAPAAPARVP